MTTIGSWASTAGKLLDPYELKARLLPGLLIFLPLIIFFALTWGPRYPKLIALMSVLMACGGPYVLASMVRTWGLRAQKRLVRRWGALPTTILLRHRDKTLPAQTKSRYGELIAKKLMVRIASLAEEAADPDAADDTYVSAADKLRPLTDDRAKFPLLFKELVQYGFNRNAHGVRWIGFSVALLTFFVMTVHSHVIDLVEAHVRLAEISQWSLPEWITAGFSILMMFVWIFHFTVSTVEQSGYAYGRRLWEALDKAAKRPVQAKVRSKQL